MRFFGPPGQINRSVRFYEQRVARRVGELLAADPKLRREDARRQAQNELNGTSGSPKWERTKRKQAAKAEFKGLVTLVKQARRTPQ